MDNTQHNNFQDRLHIIVENILRIPDEDATTWLNQVYSMAHSLLCDIATTSSVPTKFLDSDLLPTKAYDKSQIQLPLLFTLVYFADLDSRSPYAC